MTQTLYEFHGLDRQSDTTYICPWCDKPKFNVAPDTFQYRCFSCEADNQYYATGNVYTFLSAIAANVLQNNLAHPHYLDELSSAHRVSPLTLHHFGIGRHPFLPDSYFLPIRNAEDKIVHAYLASFTRGKWRLFASPRWPGVNRVLCPYFSPSDTVPPSTAATDAIFIVEGHWDVLALYDALRYLYESPKGYCSVDPSSIPPAPLSLLSRYGVIGIPGSGNPCLDTLRPLLNSRPAIVCMDADRAGYAATNKLQGELSGTHLIWNSTPPTPDGYDISDLIRDLQPGPALSYLIANQHPNNPSPSSRSSSSIYPGDQSTITPLPLLQCESFFDLLTTIGENNYHLDPVISNGIAVSLAVMLSTELAGDQLWLRSIGPPGAGKTSAVMPFFRSSYVFPISELRGFHSGFTQGKTEDSSLIPLLDRKTAIIPDTDVLLSSPSKDKILSELRDIYDGQSSAVFRNGVLNRYYGLRMTFILCGTASSRQLNRAHLGERFLDYDLTEGLSSRRGAMVDKSISRMLQLLAIGFLPKDLLASPNVELEGCACGFLDFLKRSSPPLYLSTATEPPIVRKLANWIATIRSVPAEENEYEELEVPTRLSQQLTKLWYCLHWVLSVMPPDSPTPSVPYASNGSASTIVNSILRKMARDTAHSTTQSITQSLYEEPGTAFDLERRIHRSVTSIRHCLHRLQARGVVCRREYKSDGPGRNSELWSLTKNWTLLAEEVLVP